MKFEDRVVLVTGAGRGLGRELALAFGKQKAKVVVNYFQGEEGARETASVLETQGGTAFVAQADVRDGEQVDRLTQAVIDRWGRVDILVNNAGIHADNPVWKMTDEQWDSVLDVNLKGVFNCCRSVMPHMRSQNWGRIVNISSVVGQVGVFGTANYAAAKAGLFGLTKTLAREGMTKNTTVNVLSLGYISVGMLLSLEPEIQDAVLGQIPMGRFGKVNEVTSAALFLASDEAGYITGQSLNINGGCYM